jgi:hypothetical protein
MFGLRSTGVARSPIAMDSGKAHSWDKSFVASPCASKRTVVTCGACARVRFRDETVATKEHKRQARGLIEALESRVHAGPPIHATELVSAREFLRQSEFSPGSDYFNRLSQIQDRLGSRSSERPLPQGKRNYGGEAAGYWMQIQSAYDHVILSTCYDGNFNLRQGRIKISHRFNQAGRIDFVELKFLRSLQPTLNGAIRKLLTVKDYQSVRKDWRVTEAFVLEVLPRELIFLYESIFRCPKSEMFAWLINIGHRLIGDLLKDLKTGSVNGFLPETQNSQQLCLQALQTDEVTLPILQKAATLECSAELRDSKTVAVSYG